MDEEVVTAAVPKEFRALRACIRCSLVKTFEQFLDAGCENCEFMNLEGSTARVQECTTSYFEGLIALVEADGSWVANWQQIQPNLPGCYAVELVGELPDDVLEYCDSYGLPHKSTRAKFLSNTR